MLFCPKGCSGDPETKIHFRYYYGKSTELAEEIDRFKRLVQSSETMFDRNATARDVSRWLAKPCLLDSTPYLRLCLKLYLAIGVSIASCAKNFLKHKMTNSFLRKFDFEDIIAVFASTKAYKVQF